MVKSDSGISRFSENGPKTSTTQVGRFALSGVIALLAPATAKRIELSVQSEQSLYSVCDQFPTLGKR